jgi:hypothetical protein
VLITTAAARAVGPSHLVAASSGIGAHIVAAAVGTALSALGLGGVDDVGDDVAETSDGVTQAGQVICHH